jgi:A/G-specific adenine glycosylase
LTAVAALSTIGELRETTAALLAWYARFGRGQLPWRQTRDPYAVVVAEFMLQQTQVDRVLPAYRAFLERFPSFAALAAADAGEVMRAWRGLGYNSRAARLRALAQTVVDSCGGVMPREREALLALPGIGPYTAAAVRAFAFDESDAALDTNIRRVVQRVAFGREHPVRASEREIDRVAQTSVPAGRGHDWNSAMMDLGAAICTARAPKCLLCPLQSRCAAAPIDPVRLAALAKAKSKRSPQEALPFERTTRFLRGRIVDRLRDLAPGEAISCADLKHDLASIVPDDRLDEIPAALAALVREGIVFESPLGLQLESGVRVVGSTLSQT